MRSGLKLPDFLQGGVFFEVSDLSRKRFKVLPVLFRVFFNRFNGRNGYAICLTPFHRVFIRQFRTPQIKQGNCDRHRYGGIKLLDLQLWPTRYWSQVLISRSARLSASGSRFRSFPCQTRFEDGTTLQGYIHRSEIALDGHTFFKSFILIPPAIQDAKIPLPPVAFF